MRHRGLEQKKKIKLKHNMRRLCALVQLCDCVLINLLRRITVQIRWLSHSDLANIICLQTFHSDLSLGVLPPGERYLFCCVGVLGSSSRAEKRFICIQRPPQRLLCSALLSSPASLPSPPLPFHCFPTSHSPLLSRPPFTGHTTLPVKIPLAEPNATFPRRATVSEPDHK